MFYRQYCKEEKKTKFLAAISLFHLFLNCKIKPQSSCQQSYFCGRVFICQSDAQKKKKKSTCTKLSSVASALQWLKWTHPYEIVTQCQSTSLLRLTPEVRIQELLLHVVCVVTGLLLCGVGGKKRNVTGVILATDDWAASHSRRLIMTRMISL